MPQLPPGFRIITGGQTGADRAALDAAMETGIPCGGWCPADRSAEDGPIPQKYPLTPLPGGGYDQRTHRNVADSDGTVILCFGKPIGGSETTRRAAVELSSPLLLIDAATASSDEAAGRIADFVRTHQIATLNIAGPRASEQPRIAAYVRAAITAALRLLK
jgi:hypothetical protein